MNKISVNSKPELIIGFIHSIYSKPTFNQDFFFTGVAANPVKELPIYSAKSNFFTVA